MLAGKSERSGKMKRFISTIVLSLIGAGSALAHGNNGWQMGGRWGHMMGYGYGGGWLMWILFIVLIVIVVYLLVQTPKRHDSGSAGGETPLQILKKRYAKGEISKEDFDRMRKDLEG
jgi:putative membrane protein